MHSVYIHPKRLTQTAHSNRSNVGLSVLLRVLDLGPGQTTDPTTQLYKCACTFRLVCVSRDPHSAREVHFCPVFCLMRSQRTRLMTVSLSFVCFKDHGAAGFPVTHNFTHTAIIISWNRSLQNSYLNQNKFQQFSGWSRPIELWVSPPGAASSCELLRFHN